MITILEKFEKLKDRMEYFDIFQKEDEIDLLLTGLLNEIKSYKELEIYKEDFSDTSWSYITKNDNISFVKVYIKVN